jgi:hypothetical protein
VLAKIEEMKGTDRTMAKRLHPIITENGSAEWVGRLCRFQSPAPANEETRDRIRSSLVVSTRD